jgi:hypothetical protein
VRLCVQDMLDGDGDENNDHAGVSDGEGDNDLDDYLKELGADSEKPDGSDVAGAADGNGANEDDLDKYLGELDLDGDGEKDLKD